MRYRHANGHDLVDAIDYTGGNQAEVAALVNTATMVRSNGTLVIDKVAGMVIVPPGSVVFVYTEMADKSVGHLTRAEFDGQFVPEPA